MKTRLWTKDEPCKKNRLFHRISRLGRFSKWCSKTTRIDKRSLLSRSYNHNNNHISNNSSLRRSIWQKWLRRKYHLFQLIEIRILCRVRRPSTRPTAWTVPQMMMGTTSQVNETIRRYLQRQLKLCNKQITQTDQGLKNQIGQITIEITKMKLNAFIRLVGTCPRSKTW